MCRREMCAASSCLTSHGGKAVRNLHVAEYPHNVRFGVNRYRFGRDRLSTNVRFASIPTVNSGLWDLSRCARKRHSRNRHGAVILHGKFQPPVQAPQGNLCSACSSVACNVAQSLLRDAKEAQRHVLRQCIGNVRVFTSSRTGHCEKRSHSAFNASIKPRSSRMEGWRDGGDTKGVHVLAQRRLRVGPEPRLL